MKKILVFFITLTAVFALSACTADPEIIEVEF